jgi:hypothetical protein
LFDARLALANDQTPRPLRTVSVAELLQGVSNEWLVGRLESNPMVLTIGFPNLAEQAQAMNRIAAFVEKADAPRNRVLDNAELSGLIARAGDLPETFYLGHDYSAENLAAFFAQVRRQELPLNAQEEQLFRTLLTERLVVQSEELHPGEGSVALITISQLPRTDLALLKLPSDDRILAAAILEHEISHGEFHTRPDYQTRCWYFWKSQLTESERKEWRLLLQSMGYDTNNENLLVNEMQALLMHTPDARYFGEAQLRISKKQLLSQRRRFAASAKP